MDVKKSSHKVDFPAARTGKQDVDAGKEQLTIIIEQGTVVSFMQRKIYPYLEGTGGEGI